MTSSLPVELLEVLDRRVTTELVTIDERGRPAARPVTPALHADESCIDIDISEATGAAANPQVALLLSDADADHMVLVQGTAFVDDRVHVRPERVYAWPGADSEAEPRLYDSHVEEVRSAHNEEPETGHAGPRDEAPAWDARLDELDPTAALAFVGPDGFPFAVRVPVASDRAAGVVRIGVDPVGAPIEPGPASLCARGLRVVGDLLEDRGDWLFRPYGIAS